MSKFKIFVRLFAACSLLGIGVLAFAYPFATGMLVLLGADPANFALTMAGLFVVASVLFGLLMANMLLDRFTEKAQDDAEALELLKRGLAIVEASDGAEDRVTWIRDARSLLEKQKSRSEDDPTAIA